MNHIQIEPNEAKGKFKKESQDQCGLLYEVNYLNLKKKGVEAKAIDIAPDGNSVVVGDNQGNIYLYDFRTSTYKLITKNVKAESIHYSVRKPQDFMLSTKQQRQLLVFNINGEKTGVLKGHKTLVRGFSVNQTHQLILSYSNDKAIVWKTQGKEYVKVCNLDAQDFNSPILQAQFCLDDSYISVLVENGMSTIYRYEDFEIAREASFSDTAKFMHMQISTIGGFFTGMCPYIMKWTLDEQSHPYQDPTLQFSYFQLPFQRSLISQAQMINQELYLLSCEGDIMVFNMNTGELILNINLNENLKDKNGENTVRIKSFNVDQKGTKISMILSQGNVLVYDCNRAVWFYQQHIPDIIKLEQFPNFAFNQQFGVSSNKKLIEQEMAYQYSPRELSINQESRIESTSKPNISEIFSGRDTPFSLRDGATTTIQGRPANPLNDVTQMTNWGQVSPHQRSVQSQNHMRTTIQFSEFDSPDKTMFSRGAFGRDSKQRPLGYSREMRSSGNNRSILKRGGDQTLSNQNGKFNFEPIQESLSPVQHQEYNHLNIPQQEHNFETFKRTDVPQNNNSDQNASGNTQNQQQQMFHNATSGEASTGSYNQQKNWDSSNTSMLTQSHLKNSSLQNAQVVGIGQTMDNNMNNSEIGISRIGQNYDQDVSKYNPLRQSSTMNKSGNSASISGENQSYSQASEFQRIYYEQGFQPRYDITNYDSRFEGVPPNPNQMLAQFGQFPSAQRYFIWKRLLDLPLNKDSFESLIRKQMPQKWMDLYKVHPIEPFDLYKRIVHILSTLSHWQPGLTGIDYLPGIVYPFVKCIEADDLVVFEIMVYLISHWCQHWFQFYPTEPINLLQAADEVLKREDLELHNHLVKQNFTVSHYIWPLVKHLYSEVLSKEDWLILFDFIFANNQAPQMLILFSVSFLIHFRNDVLQCNEKEELANFLSKNHGEQIYEMQSLLQNTKHMYEAYNDLLSSMRSIKFEHSKFIGLGDFYPAKLNLPMSVPQSLDSNLLELQVQKTLKELDYLSMKQQQNQILDEEMRLRAHQDRVMKLRRDHAERDKIDKEMKQRQEQQVQLAVTQQRLDRVKDMEEMVHVVLKNQNDARISELVKIDEEYEQMKQDREKMFQSRVQQETLQNIEFRTQQRLGEIMDLRKREEASRRIRAEAEFKQREEYYKDQITEEKWNQEDEQEQLQRQLKQTKLAREAQLEEELTDQKMVDLKHQLFTLEKEMQKLKIEKERKIRQIYQDNQDAQVELQEDMIRRDTLMRKQTQTMLQQTQNDIVQNEVSMAEQRLREVQEEKDRLNYDIMVQRQQMEQFQDMQQRQEYQNRVEEVRAQQEMEMIDEQRRCEQLLRDVQMQKEQRRIQQMRQSQANTQIRGEIDERDLALRYREEAANMHPDMNMPLRNREEMNYENYGMHSHPPQTSIPDQDPLSLRDRSGPLRDSQLSQQQLYTDTSQDNLQSMKQESQSQPYAQTTLSAQKDFMNQKSPLRQPPMMSPHPYGAATPGADGQFNSPDIASGSAGYPTQINPFGKSFDPKHSRLTSFGNVPTSTDPKFEHGLATLGGRTYDLSSSSNYSTTNGKSQYGSRGQQPLRGLSSAGQSGMRSLGGSIMGPTPYQDSFPLNTALKESQITDTEDDYEDGEEDGFEGEETSSISSSEGMSGEGEGEDDYSDEEEGETESEQDTIQENGPTHSSQKPPLYNSSNLKSPDYNTTNGSGPDFQPLTQTMRFANIQEETDQTTEQEIDGGTSMDEEESKQYDPGYSSLAPPITSEGGVYENSDTSLSDASPLRPQHPTLRNK